MIIILGAPGGGTSYFTKFLRLNGFYAGKSLEEGKNDNTHIGYLHRRKWHESITVANKFINPIMSSLNISRQKYETLFGSNWSAVETIINQITEDKVKNYIKNNSAVIEDIIQNEFPLKDIPYGFKNPRNFMLLPYLKEAFPQCKILTVERHINPNPSNQGPEGKGFWHNCNNKKYRKFVYDHEDDFRFCFEDFLELNKVNNLLEFVGLTPLNDIEQLKDQHKFLEFDIKKITR